MDAVLAETRALNEQIEAEGRADTERLIAMAEEANTILDEAAKFLSDVDADINATEAETVPEGGEQIALELANLRKEAGL